MLVSNSIPLGRQRAIKVVIDGRGIVPRGHRARALPELRGVGLPPVKPANDISGRREDMRGHGATGAESTLCPLRQFTLKGIRTLRTPPFDEEQQGLGPMAMAQQDLHRHVGVESPTEFSIRVDTGGESNLQACTQIAQQLPPVHLAEKRGQSRLLPILQRI